MQEDGERMAMRRETEKNYVDKWERARVENFKLQFRAEELKLQREIKESQIKLESEQIVDAENEKFLDHSINVIKRYMFIYLTINILHFLRCILRKTVAFIIVHIYFLHRN